MHFHVFYKVLNTHHNDSASFNHKKTNEYHEYKCNFAKRLNLSSVKEINFINENRKKKHLMILINEFITKVL